ncbi:MAG: hypothetical protein MJH11_16790 [Lentisphaeria bacterium]|nr:hypothetical protein [Lentisphaeria bacterium]
MMPEMMGTELAAKLVEINADLPVIFLTGFNEEFEDGFSITHNEYWLKKPILSSDLDKAVRRAMKVDIQH